MKPAGDGSNERAWSLDYVDDAATKRVDIRSPAGRLWTGCSNYETPQNGVHLCGETDDGEQPTTVAVYPMPRGSVEPNWRRAREVAMCGRDEADFVVDLFLDGSNRGRLLEQPPTLAARHRSLERG